MFNSIVAVKPQNKVLDLNNKHDDDNSRKSAIIPISLKAIMKCPM